MNQEIERRYGVQVMFRDQAESLRTAHSTGPGRERQQPDRARCDVIGPEPQNLPGPGDIEGQGVFRRHTGLRRDTAFSVSRAPALA